MSGRNIRTQPMARHVLRPHPALMEEKISLQHREIQNLLVDNQRLAATHVALKQELSLAQQELRHLSSTYDVVKSESEAQVRGVYEKAVMIESEVRSIEPLKSELIQVRDDVVKMSDDQKMMIAKLEEIEGEIVKARSEMKEFTEVKDQIEYLRSEIQQGRAALDYEQVMHVRNSEIGQILEENKVSLTGEIEKLHGELANAEKMARAAAAAAAAATPALGHTAAYGADMGYGANSYAHMYAPQQVQGYVDTPGPYGSGAAAAYGPYGTQ